MDNGLIKFIMLQNHILYFLYIKELSLTVKKLIFFIHQKLIHKLWLQKSLTKFIKISKIQTIILFI